MRTVSRGNVVSRRQFNAIALKSAAIPVAAGFASAASPIGAALALQQEGTPTASPGATPVASGPTFNWSNGAKELWRYESGSSYWVERNGLTTGGGVFGVFKDSGTGLEVFDAVSYERLWGFPRGGGSYRWRNTADMFFIMQGDTLIGKAPRTGEQRWTFNTQSEDFGIEINNSAGYVIAYDKEMSNNMLYLLEIGTGKQLYTVAIGTDSFQPIFDANQLVLVHGNTMTLLDLPSGKRRWSFVDHGAPITNWDRYTFEDSVMITSGSTLTLLDAATGQTVWSFTAPADSPTYTGDESMLYVTSGASKSALDPATGDELWRFTGSGDSITWWIHDTVAYAISGSILSAIDLENGAELWRYTRSDGDILSSRVSIEGDQIAVAAGRTIIALDRLAGTEQWHVEVPGMADQLVSRWRAENGDIVAVSDTRVVAIEPRLGSVKWTIAAEQEIKTPYWSGVNGERIVIVDNTVHAIGSANADRAWSTEQFQSPDWDNARVVGDGTVLVPTSRQMILISLGDGTIRARFGSTDHWQDDDGVIYATIDANAVAIDLTTGKTLWQTPLNSIDTSLSTSIAGYLLCSNSAVAMLLDRATGAMVWRTSFAPYNAWYDILESSIVFCDVGGTFTAFGPKEIALEAGGSAITTKDVTLRGAPNAKSVERATLPKGTTVTITGASESNGGETWWPVDTGNPGGQGWLPADSLEPTGNAPAK